MCSAGKKRKVICAWMGVLLLLVKAAGAGGAEGVQLTLQAQFAGVEGKVEKPVKKAFDPRGSRALELGERGAEHPPERFGKGLYLGAALALSAGVLALWTKAEADDAYDEYLRAANQQRQKDEFNRAENYDRISGTALVVMEVGLALTAYTIFF